MTDCPVEGRQQGPPDGAAALVLIWIYIQYIWLHAEGRQRMLKVGAHLVRIVSIFCLEKQKDREKPRSDMQRGYRAK